MLRTAINKLLICLPIIGLAAFCLALMLRPGPASGTIADMQKLPTFTRFQCLLCHTTAQPTAQNADLNAFGNDFLENGRIWNQALAMKNSDEDGCTNGFELSDRDGDGKPDFGAHAEESNPGNPTDCSVAFTRFNWGVLKKVFGND